LKAIVFFNNKGGVGKTTLACNVVSYINQNTSKRALLIDADPQCNATQAVLSEELCEDIYLTANSVEKTIFSYVRPIQMGESSIYLPVNPILGSQNRFSTDIIPGHPKMSVIEDRLSDAWNKLLSGDISGIRVTNWCTQMLENLAPKYDLIIFDVGPSLGALNRTVILSSDYIVTPFGCDIFSLLGIKNISDWIKRWNELYLRGLELAQRDEPDIINNYPIIKSTDYKFRFAGYSIQQYVQRKFKEGVRPVKAYDKIMQKIPDTVKEVLEFITDSNLNIEQLELGHIPYVYSLVPMAQSGKVPIHKLTSEDGLKGNQYAQVKSYGELMSTVCLKLQNNIKMR
jgi:cellulose biosynthesis protein BcsQ